MSSDDDSDGTPSDTWPCSVCNWTFLSKSSLEKHKKTHTADKPFSCQECDVKFASSHGLKIHMRKHTGERPYKCEQCPKAFTTRTVLIMHMRGHTGEKPFVCKVCGASYTQNASLTYHMDKHNKNKQYKCLFCEESFQDLRHRLQHVRKVHYQETCGVCKQKFKTKKGLLAHEEKHAYDKSMQCDLCGKIFLNKSVLINHIKKHNPSYIKCNICGKEISEIIKSQHKKTHFPDQCSLCPGIFTNLKRHMRVVHNNPNASEKKIQLENRRRKFRRYICKICGYRSDEIKKILRHDSKCQLQPKFVMFLCDFCQKECPDYQSFEAHVFEHCVVRMRLPFVPKKRHYNPARHVQRKNASKSNHATEDGIVSSPNPTDPVCSDIVHTAANETIQPDRFPSHTVSQKYKEKPSITSQPSSAVGTYGAESTSVQNVDDQQPRRSYGDQRNHLAVPIEEEISIKEENIAEESISHFQNGINRGSVNFPRHEISTSSFVHYDGILYMKPEQH